jgi:hypothetical protein
MTTLRKREKILFEMFETEKFPFELDWTTAINEDPGASSITAIAVVVYDANGVDQTSSVITGTPSVSSPKSYFTLDTPSPGQLYNIFATATLDNGPEVGQQLEMAVPKR